MTIFRTRTAVFALLATIASVGVVEAQSGIPNIPDDAPNFCPESPPVTTDPGTGGSCTRKSQSCSFPGLCAPGLQYQCRCATAGDPFVCSCRGDLGLQSADNVTDAETLDLGDESAAFSATAFSSLMISGAFAAVAASL